jgi:hypothetical protein
MRQDIAPSEHRFPASGEVMLTNSTAEVQKANSKTQAARATTSKKRLITKLTTRRGMPFLIRLRASSDNHAFHDNNFK